MTVRSKHWLIPSALAGVERMWPQELKWTKIASTPHPPSPPDWHMTCRHGLRSCMTDQPLQGPIPAQKTFTTGHWTGGETVLIRTKNTWSPPTLVSKTPPPYPTTLDTWSLADHQLIATPQGYITEQAMTEPPLLPPPRPPPPPPPPLTLNDRSRWPHSSENQTTMFFQIRSDV